MAVELSDIKKPGQEMFMHEWTANGTLTVPKGCRVIFITAVGAGGEGGISGTGDGGKSGMIVADKPFICAEGDTVNVTTGAGDSTVAVAGTTAVVARAAGAGSAGRGLAQSNFDPYTGQLSGGVGGGSGESSSYGTGGAGYGSAGGGAAGFEGNGGNAPGGNGTGFGSGGAGGGANTAGPGMVRIYYWAFEAGAVT